MEEAIHVYEASGKENTDAYEFLVEVTSMDGSSTRHSVTLDPAYYAALAAHKRTPEEVVELSFYFLLEREPKDAILPSFDLSVISEYFPEYEREITKRINDG